MSNESQNNKRIAKNTLFLYGRMFLMMIISLYTSRVVLKALGVEDYGIYNVVGGVVALFTILSGSLSAAIQRFITYELGAGNSKRLKKVFSTSINVQIVLIIIITILLETIGLWFLNNKLVIPDSRMYAANWLYQFSVITFAINLWSIPYNAEIIAHEKMSVFAYISIIEAVSKLIIAFVIFYEPFDRLIFYGLLVLVVSLIVRLLYGIYCSKHFEECHYSFIYDKELLKKMFGFSGWNFIGAASAVLRDQGGNIIMNLFFGPAVNAARGVSMSVNNAIHGFSRNFMTSLNPQITKNYAIGNYEYMYKLAFQGARLSYYILFILALPILTTTPYLLDLWLDNVPEHASNFTRLAVVFTLSESLASPLVTVMLATGNIRNYQLLVGGCQLLNLPISYFLLYLGFPPESVFYVAIIISITCEMLRLAMLKHMVKLPVSTFFKKVYFNVILVSVVAALIPIIISRFVVVNSFFPFLFMVSLSFLSAVVTIYTIGCSKSDRVVVHKAIKKIISRIK